MSTMRAVDIKGGSGLADALFINDKTPMPTPRPADAIIRVKAFGLNRADLLQREGKYPVPPGVTSIIGLEFSGVIHRPAEDGEVGFKEGDEVFGLTYGGAYAEFVAVSTHMLIHKPKYMSWEQAAGIPETYMTALGAMYLVGEWAHGKSILWHAGASSVSISGIQLARNDKAGAIYVTAGSQEKIDFCVNELGATAGFNYKTQNWSEEVLKATDGKGVDIIIDFVGATYFQGNLNATARDGRVVLLGTMGGTHIKDLDIRQLLLKRIRYEGSTLRSRDEKYQGRLRDTLVEHALPQLEDGSLKVFIEQVFPWEKIREAHQLIESNQTKGKVICTIS